MDVRSDRPARASTGACTDAGGRPAHPKHAPQHARRRQGNVRRRIEGQKQVPFGRDQVEGQGAQPAALPQGDQEPAQPSRKGGQQVRGAAHGEVWCELGQETVNDSKQQRAAQHARQVIGRFQRQATPRGRLAQEQVLHIDQGAGMLFGRVGVGKEPLSAPALAHVGQVRVDVLDVIHRAAKGHLGRRERPAEQQRRVGKEQGQRGPSGHPTPFAAGDHLCASPPL